MATRLHLVGSGSVDSSPPAGLPVRVGLAEEHPVLRRCLRGLVEADGDLRVVVEAPDVEHAARQAHRQLADVLVVDLPRLDRGGLEAIGRLRGQLADARIVVMTMDSSPAVARRALRAGASAFVRRDHADSELATAIRTAVDGGEYISPLAGHGTGPG